MNAQNPFPAQATMDGYQRISGTCSESDDIQLFTGNLMKILRIIQVPTIGIDLSLVLTYNSLDVVLGAIGNKWRHNYMATLSFSGGPPPTQVTYTSDSGRQYGFVLSSGVWVPDGASSFIQATLTNPSSNWYLTYFDNSALVFNSSGQLIEKIDTYGNTTTLNYTGTPSLLTSITEPTGRSITLSYTLYGTQYVITSATDPNGNVITLGYDITNLNLTSVTWASGCSTTYTYATPSNSLITQRADALLNTYTYTYDSSDRLTTVTDAETEATTISYSYNNTTYAEFVADDTSPPTSEIFALTTMTYTQVAGVTVTTTPPAAPAPPVATQPPVWQFIFDTAGNLWRIIDPMYHWTHQYFNNNQQLMYRSAGYPLIAQWESLSGMFTTEAGPRDNINNAFNRYAYQENTADSTGNSSFGPLEVEADPTGMVTQYTYDTNHRLIAIAPGQGNFSVQGNWQGQYGSQGYVLANTGSDIVSLPSYVSAYSVGGTATSTDTNYKTHMDPRALFAPNSKIRNNVCWESSSSYTITITATDGTNFNLSLYSQFTSGYTPGSPGAALNYYEAFGEDLWYDVTDAVGTQHYHVTNNASGVWTTFPVTAGSSPISITVRPWGNNTNDVRISALAFDPYDNHRVSLTYNSNSQDIASVTFTTPDGTTHTTSRTFNTNGTVATIVDANSNTTSLAYQDTAQNLTQITDALNHVTHLSYDANGNLLTCLDANGHLWRYTYDDKNRPVTAIDPLGNTYTRSYYANGNLETITDPNGNVTTFSYTPTSRLYQITDALTHNTTFKYDFAGNLISIEDTNGNTTTLSYDNAYRLISIQQPDTYTLTAAWDALNRLRAITTPNGTQSNPANIITQNAGNFLQNPGAELASPFHTTTSLPLDWIPSGSGSRDTTIAYTGNASFKLTGASTFRQDNVVFPPGAQALGGYMAFSNNATASETVQMSVQTQQSNQTAVSAQNGNTLTIPANTSTWLAAPPSVFSVAGDVQYDRYTIADVSIARSGSGPSTWLDNTYLYNLSTAMAYDQAGRPSVLTLPDGTTRTLVRDRYGRVAQVIDGRGEVSTFTYDGINRLLSVTVPTGSGTSSTTSFTYDAVGNVTVVQDPNSNQMQYAYDALNRVQTITYPDTTTETFAYDALSNVMGYTNNRGQSRTLFYDGASRLVQMLYNTDQSSVLWQYDGVGNLVRRVDRNGDTTNLVYDALNRLVYLTRDPSTGYSATSSWQQAFVYDNVGNLLDFYNGYQNTEPEYDVSEYDVASIPQPILHWSAPSNYDNMNRLPEYQDRLGNDTKLTYDVESRLQTVQFPYTSPVLTTLNTYDIMGRPTNLSTTTSSTNPLNVSYAYDQNSNRNGMSVAGDSFDYAFDPSNRLTHEDINRFSHRTGDRFASGTGVGTDVSSGQVSQLAFADTFSGQVLNLDRWRPTLSVNNGTIAVDIRQNNALTLVYPYAYNNLFTSYNFNALYVPYFPLAVGSSWFGCEHRTALTGDFDIQVEFSDFASFPFTSPGSSTMTAGIMVADTPMETAFIAPANFTQVAIFYGSSGYEYQSMRTLSGTPQTPATVFTSDTAGTLRIARSGSTITTSYYVSGVQTFLETTATFTSNTVYLSLFLEPLNTAIGGVAFTNLSVNSGVTAYPTTSTYTSPVYDAGQTVNWSSITWEATPSNSDAEFQVAFSNSPNGPFVFNGPSGPSSYYTTPGSSLSATGMRYAQYQATLSGSGTAATTLEQVDMLFAGTNTSMELTYVYDAAGNLTSKTTEAAGATTITETRTVNNLNQITANSVVGSSTTNWSFTYDASGNMKTRVNTTLGLTTTYNWDEDNRLTSVVLPSGGGTISYTYDVGGRMLTRTDSSGTSYFAWSGVYCVQETDASGNVTRYYMPDGVLRSFDRNGTVYQVYVDGIGSVRLVTDTSGNTKASFQYDAWGNQLPTSYDNVPNGGLMYRYIGALGVRYDVATGLYYMQQRWYDQTLCRFLGRDQLRLTNRYPYAANNPSLLVDPYGLMPGGQNPFNRLGTQVHSEFFELLQQLLREAGITGVRINQQLDILDVKGNKIGYGLPDVYDPEGVVFKLILDLKTTAARAIRDGFKQNQRFVVKINTDCPGARIQNEIVSYDPSNPNAAAAAEETLDLIKQGRGLKVFIGGLSTLLGTLGIIGEGFQAYTDIQNIRNGTAPTIEPGPNGSMIFKNWQFNGDPNGYGGPLIIITPFTIFFEIDGPGPPIS